MGSPGRRALLVAAAILGGLSPGRLCAEEEDRFVVADFDDPSKASTVAAEGSEVHPVPESRDSKTLAGSWVFRAGAEAALVFRNLPPDPGEWRALRLRIRRDTGSAPGPTASPGIPSVLVASSPADDASARLPGIAAEWRTFVLDLDRMAVRGAFDRSKVREIRIRLAAGHEGGSFDVDDVVLEKEYAEPLDRRARALAAAWTVEDFEASGVEDRAEGRGGSLQPMVEKASTGFLRWVVGGGTEPATLALFDLPRDPGAYRGLRFRLRASAGAVPLVVRIRSGAAGSLAGEVKRPGAKWEAVEMPFASMKEEGRFDLARCDAIEFSPGGPAQAALDLDDVALEKGPERLSAGDRATLETLFGKAKAPKALRRATKHFDLFTDSQQAAEKLPDGLEKACAFVKETLGLPEMEAALPVYAFQNVPGLQEFLERERGLTKKQMERLTAHGTPRSLEFLYRSPDDGGFVRALAQSLFQRARGSEGGSWMHEGMGMYLRSLWDKQDAAADFAPNLRSGKFLPLRDLVAIPDLQEYDDPKGGVGDRRAVLNEAGALYAFLVRGPLAEKWREAEKALARRKAAPADRAKVIEEALSLSLEDLERAWVEWGGKASRGK